MLSFFFLWCMIDSVVKCIKLCIVVYNVFYSRLYLNLNYYQQCILVFLFLLVKKTKKIVYMFDSTTVRFFSFNQIICRKEN